jgi:elongation factor Tu
MFRMTVEDVFDLSRPRGFVATGHVDAGEVRVDDELVTDGGTRVRVRGIEMFRKMLDTAIAGDDVGLWLDGADNQTVQHGTVLTRDDGSPAAAPPA